MTQRELLDSYASGHINRRSFIRGLVGLGASLTVAASFAVALRPNNPVLGQEYYEIPTPTNTPEPTNTPTPTNTPMPTNTPVPTNTPTPVPTATTVPTETPLPTAEPTQQTSFVYPSGNPRPSQGVDARSGVGRVFTPTPENEDDDERPNPDPRS